MSAVSLRFVSRLPRPIKSAVPCVLSSRPSSSSADTTSGLSAIDVIEPAAVSVESSPVVSSCPASSCPAASVAVLSSCSVAAPVFSTPRCRPVVSPVAAHSRPVFRRPVMSRPVVSPGSPFPSASTFQVPFLVLRFGLVPVLLRTVFGFVLSFLPVLY